MSFLLVWNNFSPLKWLVFLWNQDSMWKMWIIWKCSFKFKCDQIIHSLHSRKLELEAGVSKYLLYKTQFFIILVSFMVCHFLLTVIISKRNFTHKGFVKLHIFFFTFSRFQIVNREFRKAHQINVLLMNTYGNASSFIFFSKNCNICIGVEYVFPRNWFCIRLKTQK